MLNRRKLLAVGASVALLVVVVPALADELVGRITAVKEADKKIVVTEKGTDKEIDVTITDDTVYETQKGESKVDLEKLSKNIEKAKGKGIYVTVTHKDGVASKIKAAAKKKAEGKEIIKEKETVKEKEIIKTEPPKA